MATTALDRSAAEPALIDTQIVAELLGCSARHVARMKEAGLMPPAVKLGRLCRWSRKVIEVWIAAGCPAAGSTAR
jgi:predicted DNA-binding transcriptional regulator AlpA